ncbi:MAG: NAD(P)/FAD-dependent oxidoreductase [Acidobacteriota bacterium]
MKRRFRGLRRAPDPRYDAVVVGGGVGGLVTGLLLARDGHKVLLVEQHYMLGGYCSTFRRGGFTFEAATHFYPLLGNPQSWPGRLMRDLGVGTEWIRMDPVDAFHLPDGSRFDVPADFATYRRRLEERFPAEKDAIDRFFTEVRDAYLLGLLYYFRGRRTRRFSQYEPQTVRDALDRHFSDPALKLLLTADCPHWGGPPERTSFVFDSMLRLSYFLGNYFPQGGSQAFADELACCFEAAGGHILMSTEVDRIEVRGGRVTGISGKTLRGRLRGRHSVGTEVVISNADLRLTVERLLPAGSVAPEYRRRVTSLRPSAPCFLTHIGVHGVDRGDLERAQGYYWRHWDPDRLGRDGLICKIFVPTLYDPGLAPEGGDIVILQKVQELDYAAIDDWAAHKRGVEAEIFGHLERTLPGIGARTTVRLSASAHTSYRFTLNAAGAMLGWEMSPDQLGDARPAVEGPVDGLYLVGHWTRPGGGIVPVLVSALEVASRLGVGPPDLSMQAPSLERVAG